MQLSIVKSMTMGASSITSSSLLLLLEVSPSDPFAFFPFLPSFFSNMRYTATEDTYIRVQNSVIRYSHTRLKNQMQLVSLIEIKCIALNVVNFN